MMLAASNHALVEVAESKAKLRKLRQQLEEKTEQLAECREELDKLQVWTIASRMQGGAYETAATRRSLCSSGRDSCYE
jgi:DNA repair exonuclease SbcCD ATPase subunit